jgi:hypothetical protein
MKSKMLTSAVRVLALLLLVAGSCALAEEHRPAHFSGLINDYSPLSTSVKGSPWEMHGQWSMDLYPERETADFSADMTMSGYGTNHGRCRRSEEAPCQPSHPPYQVDERQHHLEHYRLPRIRPPATTTGFQLKGSVSLLTGNGSIAPRDEQWAGASSSKERYNRTRVVFEEH